MESLQMVKESIFSLTKNSLESIQSGYQYLFNLLQKQQEDMTIQVVPTITSFEELLESYSPYTVIIFTLFINFFIYLLICILCRLKKAWKNRASFNDIMTDLYLLLPGPKKKLEDTKKGAKEEFKKLFKVAKYKKIEFRDNSQNETTILKQIEQMAKGDSETASCGKLTGAVYCDIAKIKYIANEANKIFSYSNLLHADLYCGARFIESQLIKIGTDLFNGKEDSCGITTSGGTYSILSAIYAYVKRGKEMGITNPNIIIPVTAHAAFDKACEMFKIECIKIPIDPVTAQVNLSKVKGNINKNTICIVGSCPNFPHGIADDIESLSDIAVQYNVPLHVDCCLGGFLIAFYQKANLKIPKFDFNLKGVTSISADLHKYGLCPKGISLLLFSSHALRRYIYFSYPKFMGGFYATPTFDGSRTGGIIAASYAVLTSLGKNVYVNIAKKINEAVLKVKIFIKNECDLIKVIGDPYICSVAFTGQKIDYFYDELTRRGWHVNLILNPIGCSFVFTSANMDNVDTFIKDLKETHTIIKEGKEQPLSATTKLYGLTIPLPDKIAGQALDILLDSILD